LAVVRPLADLLNEVNVQKRYCHFEEAERILWTAIRQYPREIVPWLTLGDLIEQKGNAEEALAFWEQILAVRPEERDAVRGRWRALLQLSEPHGEGSDSLRKIVEREVRRWDTRRPRSRLSLELSFLGWQLLDADSLASRAGEILAFRYPDSDFSFSASMYSFYDSLYPVWNDNALKIPVLSRFLARSSRANVFRAEAYSLLASSLAAEKRTGALALLIDDWLRESPDDPRALDAAAFWYLERDFGDYRALKYARRATDAVYHFPCPPGYPSERWELEMERLAVSSQVNYSRALFRRGDLETASRVAQAAIEGHRPNPASDATLAGVYYVLARIERVQGQHQSARRSLVQALIAGDRRGFWTSRADSVLDLLLGQTGTVSTRLEYARSAVAYTGPRFVDVTESVGLGVVAGGRVAWGDVDGDGWEDLLVGGSRLFRNLQGRRFIEVTEQHGLNSRTGSGGLWADVDNDRDVDLLIAGQGGSGSPDRLLLNCSGFLEEDHSFPGDTLPTEGAGFGDFDADGFVDLYLARYESPGTRGAGLPDVLMQNHGPAIGFVDASKTAGITGASLAGRGVACADYDNDGDTDIFVSNYRLQPNLLWENDGGGLFTDVSCRMGVKGNEQQGWWGHSIGSAWGDFDNDGDLDLFTANLAHPRYIHLSDRSQLLMNRLEANLPFVDVRGSVGISYDETHSNPCWADVDNDGDLDLFVTSVYPRRSTYLLQNRRSQFTDVTYLAGVRSYNGWGCAFADYDGDNDLDLTVGSEEGIRLYRNLTGGQYIRIRPVGNGSTTNTGCVGCRVRIRTGDIEQFREVTAGDGTTTQSSSVQHFGLGSYRGPVEVTVVFADGEVRVLPGVAPNQEVLVFQ
jgi:tetratricopeptide (TPR) repeat protein